MLRIGAKREMGGGFGKNVLSGVISGVALAVLSGLIVSIVKRPRAQIAIDPEGRVLPGDKVKVSWKVDNADDIHLEGVGTEKVRVEKQGSQSVVITERATFRITASSGWLKSIFIVPDFLCTAVAGKSVEIITPPTVFLWAEPAEVLIGEYTTIKWSSSNADTVFIIGLESSQLQVQQAGAWQVKIDKTKTFKIVSSNRAGTETRTLTVRPRIAEPPEPSPSPSPSPQPSESPPQTKEQPPANRRQSRTCSEADTGHYGFTNTQTERVFTVTVYDREGSNWSRIITVPPGQTQYVYDVPVGGHQLLVTFRAMVPLMTFPPNAPLVERDVTHLEAEIYIEQCKTGMLEIK